MKSLSAISFTSALMKPHNGIDDNNKNRTKAIAAIPIAGIVIAAALMSGLSLINGYQPAMAQQNMTGNATTTSPTTTGGGTGVESACTPTQIGGGGGQNATTNATTTMGGGAADATTGNATMATNATTVGGGNQSTTSEVRLHIEEACIAAQNNDTEGVLLHLNLALNALEGNMTTTAGAEGGEEGEGAEGGEEGEGAEGGEEGEG